MADRIRIFATPSVAATATEANAMGIPPGTVIEMDLTRFREMARAAIPTLGPREWAILDHVLDGVEAARMLAEDVSAPSGDTIAAMIVEWADGASDDDILTAEALAERAAAWRPLTILGILMELRHGR